MFLGEPPPTQADINFRLANIPVRIHPFFWIIAVLLGIRGNEEVDPAEMLLWIVAVLISVTVHELGHALMIRRYGGRPHIVLHAFGGLAFGTPDNVTPRKHILILLAGPGAGFLFAGLIMAVIAGTGHFGQFQLELIPFKYSPYQAVEFDMTGRVMFGRIDFLIIQLLYINIAWGLINLLPVFPLDGGQIARTVMIERDPYRGAVQSLWISVIVGGGIAVLAVVNREFYIGFMFGYLAFLSYQYLQAHTGRGDSGW